MHEPLREKLAALAANLRKLPQTKGFDGDFTPVPSAVPFHKVNVEVSKGINLLYDPGMQDLTNKIWSSKTPDGRPVLVLDAPEAAKEFPYKPWDPEKALGAA